MQATQRNAGEVGQAVVAAQGNETAMMVTVSGVPPWVGRPVRLYTFVYKGSCVKHDATPAYALNDVTQPSLANLGGASGPFTLHKTVPLSMDDLRSTDYALVVRASPVDGSDDLFCGELNLPSSQRR